MRAVTVLATLSPEDVVHDLYTGRGVTVSDTRAQMCGDMAGGEDALLVMEAPPR